MSDVAWTCPSCATAYTTRPLIDGVIGCTSCGNVAARDLVAARLAMEPTEPDGYAWWQAYRLDVTNLRDRLSAAEQERDEAREIVEQLRRHGADWVVEKLKVAVARAEALSNALVEAADWLDADLADEAADSTASQADRELVASWRSVLAGREETT